MYQSIDHGSDFQIIVMEDKTSGLVLNNALNQLPFQQLLEKVFNFSLQNHFSVAVYRLPSDGKIRMLADVSGSYQKVSTDLEELPEGFIFSPFSNLDNNAALFIRKGIALSETSGLQFDGHIALQEAEKIVSSLSNFRNQTSNIAVSPNQPPKDTSKEDYCRLVSKAIDTFEEGQFQKVVISRSKTLALQSTFDILKAFHELCKNYPYAFVSVVSIPNIGTWLGASPEVLISVDKNKVFKTSAVAGTQSFQSGMDVAEVGWTQKEIEEQAMVSRYIINCFKKIRLREFEEIGPRTAQAGNLVHLKTDFIVDTHTVSYPQLGSVMINLLHPTSAVCGTPRSTSLDFISNYENYDRSFYSGYLGPVNINDESHLYVNIRCVQVFTDKVVLYAGAGITHWSKPDKEWEETEMKMKTMIDIFAKSGFINSNIT